MKKTLIISLLFLTSCSVNPDYSSLLEVKKVYIDKSERRMFLLDEFSGIIREYKINLGFSPIGHKHMEGDGRTPEGRYKIVSHNPYSEYYKSLRISYPNEEDLRVAKAIGIKNPGGNIMIHGLRNGHTLSETIAHMRGKDWTAGCVAVKNKQIDEIYTLVKDGTEVKIVP